jgi:putative ABC transport system permease protein
VGRGVTFAGRDAQVAGVVPDGRYQSLSDEGTLFAWVPRSLVYMSSANVLVRPSADLSAAVDALRATVANVDPYLPLIDVSTLESHMGQSMFLQRSAASLIGAFALVALVLSAAGIFGLLAYLVAQRRHEISVRMAIGASGVGIVRSVVGAGLRPVLGGLILGIGGALVVTRALSSLLFDVGVHDPFSFASAALVLVATAFIAAFLPARQATRVPPADALRVET